MAFYGVREGFYRHFFNAFFKGHKKVERKCQNCKFFRKEVQRIFLSWKNKYTIKISLSKKHGFCVHPKRLKLKGPSGRKTLVFEEVWKTNACQYFEAKF